MNNPIDNDLNGNTCFAIYLMSHGLIKWTSLGVCRSQFIMLCTSFILASFLFTLYSPQLRSRGKKSFQNAHDVAAGPRPYLFALMSSSFSALNVKKIGVSPLYFGQWMPKKAGRKKSNGLIEFELCFLLVQNEKLLTIKRRIAARTKWEEKQKF